MERSTYKSIKTETTGYYKEKGSKFFGFAFPIENEEAITPIRERIKKMYHDARHHVYAYRLGANMNIFRASDDGEPTNSSGQPVLNKIKSYELSDILIIVVRYFGGIKLGVPGLIHAYGTAAEDALKNAEIIYKTVKKRMILTFDYPQMNDAMRIINDFNFEVILRDFQINCKIIFEVPENQISQLTSIINENHKLLLTQNQH